MWEVGSGGSHWLALHALIQIPRSVITKLAREMCTVPSPDNTLYFARAIGFLRVTVIYHTFSSRDWGRTRLIVECEAFRRFRSLDSYLEELHVQTTGQLGTSSASASHDLYN